MPLGLASGTYNGATASAAVYEMNTEPSGVEADTSLTFCFTKHVSSGSLLTCCIASSDGP